MAGKSYDVRMEDLPLFISYPRSGSNWLNCLMELYFDKPRLRTGPVTFLKDRDSRSDYMWFHDHDIFSDLTIKHLNILYLYRNPCDVIYSLLKAEHGRYNDSLVDTQIKLLQNHYKKYMHNNKCILRYEDLKKDLSIEFLEILRFFNINGSLNENKLINCNRKVKKEEVINKEVDKRYFSRKLLSKEYADDRDNFKSKYESLILSSLDYKD